MHVLKVEHWVIEKLLANKKWNRRLAEAKTASEYESVLIGFCREIGVSLHHDVVKGTLVQC